jgi:hypothetical protein
MQLLILGNRRQIVLVGLQPLIVLPLLGGVLGAASEKTGLKMS